MSLNFKNNLEGMRGNDPAGEQALETSYQASENYDTPGHVRNLCFVWPDGRMKFMNYAYLISGEFELSENSLLLIFTTAKFLLKGINLTKLFQNLLQQIPKEIKCYNPRYICIEEFNEVIVNEILEIPI